MKKLLFLVGAVALSAAAFAEIVDLNGVSLTVSAKTDINADGYTNSSGRGVSK